MIKTVYKYLINEDQVENLKDQISKQKERKRKEQSKLKDSDNPESVDKHKENIKKIDSKIDVLQQRLKAARATVQYKKKYDKK